LALVSRYGQITLMLTNKKLLWYSDSGRLAGRQAVNLNRIFLYPVSAADLDALPRYPGQSDIQNESHNQKQSRLISRMVI
jgi:hypothetical protein